MRTSCELYEKNEKLIKSLKEIIETKRKFVELFISGITDIDEKEIEELRKINNNMCDTEVKKLNVTYKIDYSVEKIIRAITTRILFFKIRSYLLYDNIYKKDFETSINELNSYLLNKANTDIDIKECGRHLIFENSCNIKNIEKNLSRRELMISKSKLLRELKMIKKVVYNSQIDNIIKTIFNIYKCFVETEIQRCEKFLYE